ncbi:MAG: aldose 1-epimerase family protein [Bacteroidota bacterium]|nr:aldose 1-epimerase family protein [Bacteroidota bacterium]MDP4213907.1 aldose 1-epimerase family protein [Bacteroidota bacterium]MDP4249519.1 aldose 1-epimerase family protein [Bacteroidota bacterium]
MYSLENDFLKVELSATGAELQRLFHKIHQLDYLWNADPAYWAKHSPVLFPIVGTLKGNTYTYQGKEYKMNRHGFARERDFVVEKQSPGELVFLLRSNAETKKQYPFDFEFRIRYSLDGDELSTEYLVKNTGSAVLLFSVGGHPAFRLPLTADTVFSDYYLRFEEKENLSRWPISPDGLIEPQPIPLLNDTDRLNLLKPLFYRDALVFKYPASSEISVLSAKTSHGINFQMGEFPFLGIWSFKDANFICIEPWCGIADSVSSNQRLENKEGIEKAAPGSTFSRQWRVRVF